MVYNWQQKKWPDFSYDLTGSEGNLLAFLEREGRVSGMLEAMPEEMQMEAVLSTMVAEAVKTSEIEGEYISREDVMSSIRNNMGLNREPGKIRDQRAAGIAELMLDVRQSYSEPLTEARLFDWHRMLMKGDSRVLAGAWRTHEDPMQVVSGAVGKEKVHFEAPPSRQVPMEMKRFVKWFNQTAPGGKKEIWMAPLRSAIVHLYFESIHPFEDGNGRIGRILSEKALSQGVARPVLLSLSQTIEKNKKDYYRALEKAQKSDDVTGWVNYFVSTVLRAQQEAEGLVNFVLKKARFFDRFKGQLNERQAKVIQRMLESDPGGFEGGMNARKYIGLTKISKATATRDLQDLVNKGILKPIGGGRASRYLLELS